MVLTDVVTNVLCVLRVFFCWVRYIFYDLQVEAVDFAFHYTDATNEALVPWLQGSSAEGLRRLGEAA
jgi:hypothetical protein